MDVDLSRLRHIIAVARLRSFSRAAGELHITQPALSRSIAAFEARFGVRLFDRGRGGVTPTALGALVVAEAERLVSSARDFEHNLQLYRNGSAGKIAFGMGPLVASLILPRLGPMLLNERPGLRMRASIGTVEQLVQELMGDTIEMMFANSAQVSSVRDVVATPIGTMRLAVIVRGAHPLVGRKRVELADLKDFPIASPVELPAAGLTGDGGAFICDNYHIMRETVAGTDCVWLASPDFVAAEIAEGALCCVELADLDLGMSELAMVRRAGRTMSPAAETVTQAVRALCGRPDRDGASNA